MTKEKFNNELEKLVKTCGGSIEHDEYRTIFTFNNNTVVVFVSCGYDENDAMLINCTKIEYSPRTDEILMYRDGIYIGIGAISVIKEIYF